MILPDCIDPEAWAGFVEMREAKGKRCPFTPRAAKMIVRALLKLRDDGHDPNASLDQSVRNGWSDVYEEKKRAPLNGFGNAETTWQRSQRELVEQMTGGLVSAKPPWDRSKTTEVIDVTSRILD